MIANNKISLKQKCISTGSCFDTDLVGLEMLSEIMDCQMLPKTRADDELEAPKTPLLYYAILG